MGDAGMTDAEKFYQRFEEFRRPVGHHVSFEADVDPASWMHNLPYEVVHDIVRAVMAAENVTVTNRDGVGTITFTYKTTQDT